MLEVRGKVKKLEQEIANTAEELKSDNVPLKARLELLQGKETLLHDLNVKERDLKRMFPLGLLQSASLSSLTLCYLPC